VREVAVGTIGFFDGVHLGHRQVIETLVSRARATGREALVITFWPHPRAVLQQDARELRLLTTLEEKKQMLLSLGVDRVEVLPFTRRLASLTAQQFVDEVLIGKFGVEALVAGYDNRIGSDNKPVSEIPGIDIIIVGEYIYSPRTDINHISSTVIRKKLEEGKVEEAGEMLGYGYTLKGVVVAGNRLGRTLGYPTANMKLYEPLKLVPGNGVYAVDVEVLGREYKGMTNIGTRPTVGGKSITIETHILDFDEDIYGLPLTIRFRRRIRDEIHFSSLEALKSQLAQDALNCKD
jgi:riboflavin kinase/FMN adenylyltransferase